MFIEKRVGNIVGSELQVRGAFNDRVIRNIEVDSAADELIKNPKLLTSSGLCIGTVDKLQRSCNRNSL
jgi:hypothetical protein